MLSKHFSLAAWGPTFEHVGDFSLIRAEADWCTSGLEPHYFFDRGWFAVTLGLFGFCVAVTYWPRGKLPLPSLDDDLGREHGEAGE